MTRCSSGGNIPNGELSENPSSPHTPEDAPSTRLDEPPPVPRRPAPHGPDPYPNGNLPSNIEDAPGDESPSASQPSASNEDCPHLHGGTSSGSSSTRRSSNEGQN